MAAEPGDGVDQEIEPESELTAGPTNRPVLRAISPTGSDAAQTSGECPSIEDDSDAGAQSAHRSTSQSAIDSAWVARVRDSYDEVRGPLWRALVAWSASPDVADEALAESFAQLLRRGPDVRDPSAWAWRSAFRLAAGDLQRRRARAGAGDDVLALLPATVDRLPDDALDLVRALAQLSDQQRRCVALVDVAGHTAPSAAKVLGTSAATVRVQLMRARRRLRTLLADPTIDSPEETP